MYGWGAGSQGQLGTGCSTDDVTSPKKVLWNFRQPHQVSCGGNHAVAVTGEPMLHPTCSASNGSEDLPAQAVKSACGVCVNVQYQKMTPVILTRRNLY